MGWHKIEVDNKNWKKLKKKAILMDTSRSKIVDRLIDIFLEEKVNLMIMKNDNSKEGCLNKTVYASLDREVKYPKLR